MYDRSFNIASTNPLATGSSNINSHGCPSVHEGTVLEKMIKIKNKKEKTESLIKTLHKKWATKNGYKNNDRFNSKNTLGFKNGAKR